MNIRKIISEQILLENRIDDAKDFVVRNYRKDGLYPASYTEGKRMPEWFNELVAIDPSGNQKYLMWGLRQIKGPSGFHPFMFSTILLQATMESIEMFHQLQNKFTKENILKSIIKRGDQFYVPIAKQFRYLYFPISKLEEILKNPKDINSYDYLLLHNLCEAIEQIPTKSMISKEGYRILDNDYWLVIAPLSYRASCHYGAGTRWCTTAKEGPEQFNRYQSNANSLFYFIPKTEVINDDVVPYGESSLMYYFDEMDEDIDISKFALHINIDLNGTFYDASDDEIYHTYMGDLIIQTYGLNSWESFNSGIDRAFDFHHSKLDKFWGK